MKALFANSFGAAAHVGSRPSYPSGDTKNSTTAALRDRIVSGKQCSSSGVRQPCKRRVGLMSKHVWIEPPRAPRRPKVTEFVSSVKCSSLQGGVAAESARGQISVKNLRWTEEDIELSGYDAGDVRRVTLIRTMSVDMDGVPVQCDGMLDQLQVAVGSSQSEIEAWPQPAVGGFTSSNQFSLDMSSAIIGASAASDVQVLAAPVYEPKLVWFAKSEKEEDRYLDRAINVTLAGAAFSYAVAKIFTIDHDYWHGWTIFEILRYAPLHNWSAYENALQRNPVLAKMMISGFVYSLGDWIGQCMEGKSVFEFNRVRLLRSGLVGFCLHGSLSHYYYHVCEFLFPFRGWWVVALEVLFDQTIWSAIWNSVYYIVLGLLRFESPATIVNELRATFFPLLSAGWKLWPFAHVVTYGFIPVEQRLLWVDCVEIIWVTILSMFANEKAEKRSGESEKVLILSSGLVENIPSEKLQ